MVVVRVSVGVPEMTQVDGLMLSPSGSEGDVTQFVISAPLLFSVVGTTDNDVPTFPETPVAPLKLSIGEEIKAGSFMYDWSWHEVNKAITRG